MAWIKRNLALVIGIAVSLLLLGGAGYYLDGNIQQDYALDDDLAKFKTKLEGFRSGTFPNEANIGIVQSNVAQVMKFTAEAEQMLAPGTTKVGDVSFSVHLPRVIDAMRREATNASVELPPKYEFTFGEVKAMPSIPSYALEPLGSRLTEVKTICDVLFKARVRGIESLQRVAAFSDEPKGPDLLLDRTVQTNVLAAGVSVTITPYRVVFRGFSGDLALVLNTLSATKDFFVVRQVEVEPATPGMTAGGLNPGMNPSLMSPSLMSPGAFGAPGPGVAPGVLTPGMAPPVPPVGVRPGVAKAPGVGVALPTPKSTLTKILDEQPLRVTLLLDVIKVTRKAVVPPPPVPN